MSGIHGRSVLESWRSLCSSLEPDHRTLLQGDTLSIPSLVAVSRYGTSAYINDTCNLVKKIDASVAFLHEELERGHSIYGVTTGFGGSADTSTNFPQQLQSALIQMQLCAVLPASHQNRAAGHTSHYQTIFSNGDALASLSIPEAWVRGAMLVRCNSLLRGHSAVDLAVMETLAKLIQNDIVPLVPLRGSISASGDLCPLSYIAGALEGNPDVYVWSGKHTERELIPSDVALQRLNIAPRSFGPKEVLGILNGTAVSAAVASLAQHQADNLAVFSQILTAMGVEALLGTTESFDLFIAAVRPHEGQTEVAQNVLRFLKGSKLARSEGDEVAAGHLRQDRYALRTSSQWIGPYLEDLSLARAQLTVELNSTTDNPMFDASTRRVHHGGNFQAASVTSATEKTRLAIQVIGKLLFAQSTELLDTRLNNGLPPNLAADEPSLSYTFKGVDINMAAYMSELAFLANPVSSHVQSAEMSNQAVNSLALISARYTHMTLDVLSLMSSAYVYALCQALDLRVMNIHFLERLQPAIEQITATYFEQHILPEAFATLQHSIWSAIGVGLAISTTKDSSVRFLAVAQAAQPGLIQAISDLDQDMIHNATSPSSPDLLSSVSSWTNQVATLTEKIFISNRDAYMENPDASPYLGVASKRMYKFIREDLGVPFHRGLVDHPTLRSGEEKSRLPRTTGSQISIIHEALKNESLIVPVMACLQDALAVDETIMGSKDCTLKEPYMITSSGPSANGKQDLPSRISSQSTEVEESVVSIQEEPHVESGTIFLANGLRMPLSNIPTSHSGEIEGSKVIGENPVYTPQDSVMSAQEKPHVVSDVEPQANGIQTLSSAFPTPGSYNQINKLEEPKTDDNPTINTLETPLAINEEPYPINSAIIAALPQEDGIGDESIGQPC